MQLTSEQLAVVHHQQGHARVRAVAGSGKTTTLVARVIHLLRQGVNPKRLLVVMYNKAAQQDFTAKLAGYAQQLANEEKIYLQLPQIRTFHSLGYKLSQSLTNWGYLPARQLIQADWQVDKFTRQALAQLAEMQNVKPDIWLEEDLLDEFKRFATLVKSGLASADIVFDELASGQANQAHFVAAFAQLEEVLAHHRVNFFDDLIWRPAQLLEQQPEIKQRLQGYLSYLIVDEYQDINSAQQSLIKTLAGDAEIMVVGDVDQCIYEWRGAKPEYMLHNLERDFSSLTDYSLSCTFRFGHSLALAANLAIHHNQKRPEQLTLAPSSKVSHIEEGIGSRWLLSKVNNGLKQLHQAGKNQAQAAILVRSWAQSLDLQLELLAANEPFNLSRPEHFIFQRSQIQAVLAYARLSLHLAAKPNVLNLPKLDTLEPSAKQRLLEDFQQLLNFPTLYLTNQEKARLVNSLAQGQEAFYSQLDSLHKNKQKHLSARLDTLAKLSKLTQQPPAQFLNHLIKLTRAADILRKSSASKEAAEEALRLIEGLASYAAASSAKKLEPWLEELEAAQAKGQLAGEQAANLTLTTVHSAKGLEWDILGVYALNENDFPYNYGFARLTPTEVEAERRLFYVAITRAKQQLYLASTPTGEVSRFVLEAELDQAKQLAELLQLAKEDAGKLPKFVAVRQPELMARYWQAYYPEQKIKFVKKPN